VFADAGRVQLGRDGAEHHSELLFLGLPHLPSTWRPHRRSVGRQAGIWRGGSHKRDVVPCTTVPGADALDPAARHPNPSGSGPSMSQV